MALAPGVFAVGGVPAWFTWGQATLGAGGTVTVGSVIVGAQSLVLVSGIDATGILTCDPASIVPSTDENTADGSFDVGDSVAEAKSFAYLVIGY